MSKRLRKEIENLDEYMREYCRNNEEIEITYVEQKAKNGQEIFSIKVNGVEITNEDFNQMLSDWVTTSNKIIVKTEGEVCAYIPTLLELDVKSVDFSGVRFKNEINGSSPLLSGGYIEEVILPIYPEKIIKLEKIFSYVNIDKKIDFNSAFRNSKITELENLFPSCILAEVDFSEVDLSETWRFFETFREMSVKSITLPKNIGATCDVVATIGMFSNSEVKEIKNLEYFPFNKITHGDSMFFWCGVKKLEINSTFSRLRSAEHMFAFLNNTTVKLPDTEILPLNDTWFYGITNCKIYIPKLNVRKVEEMLDIDDTNEIFCNRELAEKLGEKI